MSTQATKDRFIRQYQARFGSNHQPVLAPAPAPASGPDLDPSSDPDPMARVRKSAFETFRETGVPARSEAWKYTNVARLLDREFADADTVGASDVFGQLPEFSGWMAVCVNGRFRDDLSRLPDEVGITVSGLSNALQTNPDLESQLGAYADVSDEPMVALNGAFASDGVYVKIEDGVICKEPIHLVSITESSDAVIVHTRHLVLVGEAASASVIEHDMAAVGAGALTNSVFECHVKAEGNLNHYRLQEKRSADHIDSTYVRQETSSEYRACVVATGIRTIRNNITVTVAGEHCNTVLYGISLGGMESHIDTYTLIDHAEPNCTSTELYKSILCDRATATFRGKLLVRKDAQKTAAFQSNRNLLLSENAIANALPQLEIYADDVKCSHGATTGVLDQEALFYLRARGIPRPIARRMLIGAFVDEVAAEIADEPVRQRITEILDSFLDHAEL